MGLQRGVPDGPRVPYASARTYLSPRNRDSVHVLGAMRILSITCLMLGTPANELVIP